jgi:hypothetical protein
VRDQHADRLDIIKQIGAMDVSCRDTEGRNGSSKWRADGDEAPLISQLLSIDDGSLRCLDLFRMSQSATIEADPPLRLMRGIGSRCVWKQPGGPLANRPSAPFLFAQNLPHSVVALYIVGDFTGDSG